jgi:hypothetical protein
MAVPQERGNERAGRGHAAAGYRNQALHRNLRDLEPSRESGEGGEPGDAYWRLALLARLRVLRRQRGEGAKMTLGTKVFEVSALQFHGVLLKTALLLNNQTPD